MKSTSHQQDRRMWLRKPPLPLQVTLNKGLRPQKSSLVHQLLTQHVHPDVIPLIWAYAVTIDGQHLIRTLSVQGYSEGSATQYPPSFIIDANEIFLCDPSHHQVEVFNVVDGRHLRKWTSGDPFSGNLNRPVSIAVNSYEVFVAEQHLARVQVYNRISCTLARTIPIPDQPGGKLCITGLCSDGLELIVVVARPDQLLRFNQDTGAYLGSFGNSEIIYPHSISVLQDSLAVTNAEAYFVTLFQRELPHTVLEQIVTFGFKALALTACGDQLIMSGIRDPSGLPELVAYNRSSQSLDPFPLVAAPASKPVAATVNWEMDWMDLEELYDLFYYEGHLHVLFQNTTTTKILVME